MNSYLVKKMKVDISKVFICFDCFGNIFLVFILLIIVFELVGKIVFVEKVMFCGFGVGLFWVVVIFFLVNC